MRAEGQEKAFVSGDLEEEWLRQGEQHAQRPWSAAEPHLPEEQRAACVAELMVKGKGGEWQVGGKEQALGPVPVYLHETRNVYRSGGETLDGGAPPPAGSPVEQAHICLFLIAFPAPGTASVTMGCEYLLN